MWGLAFYNGTQFVPLGDRSDDNTPDPLWTNGDLAAVEARLAKHPGLTADSGFGNPIQTGTGESPTTFVFRTPSGTIGLLRFDHFSSAPSPQATVQIKRLSSGEP